MQLKIAVCDDEYKIQYVVQNGFVKSTSELM